MVEFHDAIFAVVRRIPKGRVASYGMVAALAGYPRAARYVGHALRVGHKLPWWRVLGADGSIRIVNPEWRVEQVERLKKEGVAVDGEGFVDMERHAWRPRSPGADGARRAAKGRAVRRSPVKGRDA